MARWGSGRCGGGAARGRIGGEPYDLLGRLKFARNRALVVRRVQIPTPGKVKKMHLIGIPTLEEKVLQRAVSMVTFNSALKIFAQVGLPPYSDLYKKALPHPNPARSKQPVQTG